MTLIGWLLVIVFFILNACTCLYFVKNKPQDGKDGKDGEAGPQGPQGEQGPQGKTGAKGAKGEKGDPGESVIRAEGDLTGEDIVKLLNTLKKVDLTCDLYVNKAFEKATK